ncbi:MAG: YcxB family protein [Clostridia bacterium]|nr:YcxB family protein [Clostridia bacterium]
MEIKATSKYDYETARAFYYVLTLKRIVIDIIIFAVLEAIVLLKIFLFGISTMMLAVAILIPVELLVICLFHFVGAKRFYNSLGKMKNVENEFTFFEDSFRAVSKIEGMNGGSEIKYSMIEKVVEKQDYIYIYQNKRQAFIVDKSTVIGGTVEDIRNKLIPILQKKYYYKNK